MYESPENSTSTFADDCPEANTDWPETWPVENITFAIVLSVFWSLYTLASLAALFVRRKYQPLRSRRVSLVAATTMGVFCSFVPSCLREAIGRDIFPCSVYLVFTTLSPAAMITPLVARLLHHKNRVDFQMEFLQTRTKNVKDAEVIEKLINLKFKTRLVRAYQICAGLFIWFFLTVLVYQQLQPRYYVSAACVGCEMTTPDNILIVFTFWVLVCLCIFALRRLAKLTDGQHQEVRDIETVMKILSFTALLWILFFRLDLGGLHADGILSWAYILDFGVMYSVFQLVWVPVYQTYTNTNNQGKKVLFEVVLETPALCECFENFLKTEFAVENIRFVQEVKRWQRAYPGEESGTVVLQAWLDTGNDIYNTFVHANSILEVNLNSAVKNDLAKLFEPSTPQAEPTIKQPHSLISMTLRKPMAKRISKSSECIKTSLSIRTGEEIFRDDQRSGPKLDLSPNVFDNAVFQIKRLLEMDSFPRFLASKLYAKIQNESFLSSHSVGGTMSSLSGTLSSQSIGRSRSETKPMSTYLAEDVEYLNPGFSGSEW